MATIRRTVCNRDCPDTCAILATVEGGRVTRLRGDPDHPITRGFLCQRTQRFLERQHAPDRLLAPQMRRNGVLVEVSWDEALDRIAERLLAIRAESGPASIFHYRSGGSLGVLKELTDHFFSHLGPVTVKGGDICSAAGETAQELDFGMSESNDPAELDHAQAIVLWGKNVHVSSPHLLPRLLAARRRGARLIGVDPVHHRGASLCDVTLQPRPGGDFALAMATARLCFELSLIDDDAPAYCDHLEGFRVMVEARSVADWCREADVPIAGARELALALGRSRPATLLVGWGMTRRTNGATIVRALDALGAITGNVGLPGAGVSFYHQRRAAFQRPEPAGPPPRQIPEPCLGRAVLEADDPPIRAIWITAGNPVASLPDSTATIAALQQTELVVVVDSFLTDTAEHADVVLPTTTLLEDDDLLGAYGHAYLGASVPVVPPPAGARSDLQILAALAPRVGLAGLLDGSPREWKRRMIPGLEARGVTLEQLEAGAVRRPDAPRIVFEGRRFATPSGRANLMTAAHGPPATEPPPDRPLWLLSVATAEAQCTQWIRPPEGPIPVTIHPEAPGALPDGTIARLSSAVGSLVVRLVHDRRQRADVALIPKGGHVRRGQAANLLIGARLTDLGTGGALHEEPVRIEPLS